MPRSRGAWIAIALGVALVVLIVVRAVQGSRPAEPAATVDEIRAAEGVPVTVDEVRSQRLEVWREYNGTVSGASEAIVRARTGDEISTVNVSVGDRVRRGQVLVRQRGEATEARARQAELSLRQAQRQLDRLRPLHEAGAISDADFELAQTQRELAAADLAATRDALSLTSPLGGVVTEMQARPGMIPQSGDPLARVSDLSQLVVTLRASAAQTAEIRQGQRVRLTIGNAEGRVRRIALQADAATRLVEVEVEFPPTAGLVPGTLVPVQILVAEREQAVQVAASAVRNRAVWVVTSDDRVTLRPVQTGLEGVDVVEITSGLTPGERVVVEGGTLLGEGARVRVVSDAPAGEGR